MTFSVKRTSRKQIISFFENTRFDCKGDMRKFNISACGFGISNFGRKSAERGEAYSFSKVYKTTERLNRRF